MQVFKAMAVRVGKERATAPLAGLIWDRLAEFAPNPQLTAQELQAKGMALRRIGRYQEAEAVYALLTTKAVDKK